MVGSRGAQKVERVTITFTLNADERNFPTVPSTFSAADRSYQWRRLVQMNYMLVPRKISNTEVQIDMFLSPQKKGRVAAKEVEKAVQGLIDEKMHTEWKGLRLMGISRPTFAKPPQKAVIRGTIEEILGSTL
jgi:hypothetical protein